MSSTYYYFAASLPLLEFGKTSILSLDVFLSDCERLLSLDDFMEVKKAVTLDEDGGMVKNYVIT